MENKKKKKQSETIAITDEKISSGKGKTEKKYTLIGVTGW